METTLSEAIAIPRIPRPVFVVGSYRSGTSILTWAIGAHQRFRPLEETGWIGLLGTGALAGHRVVLDAPRNFFKIYGVSLDDYMASVGRAIDDFVLLASSRTDPKMLRLRWVDGTPENTNCIFLLRQLFPAARFVFLVRDPVDVVVSLQHFDRVGGTARKVSDGARIWSALTQHGVLAYRAFGPGVVKIAQYNDLVENPDGILREIFEFLGEPYAGEAASMMHQKINSSSVTEEEHASVKRRLDRSSLGAQLRMLHDEVLALKHAPWTQDAEALHELESLQQLPTTTLASPRFAFIRWFLTRLCDKLARAISPFRPYERRGDRHVRLVR